MTHESSGMTLGRHWDSLGDMCTTLPGASAEKCCTAGYGGSPELWSDQGKGCDWYPQVVEIRLRVKN